MSDKKKAIHFEWEGGISIVLSCLQKSIVLSLIVRLGGNLEIDREKAKKIDCKKENSQREKQLKHMMEMQANIPQPSSCRLLVPSTGRNGAN